MKSQVLNIIRKIVPNFKGYETSSVFRDLGIDSIDLVTIKVEIEKMADIEIPDSEWLDLKSPDDLIALLSKRDIDVKPLSNNFKEFNETIELEIGMPQMSNSALSENWLFKEIGNLHWNLLSKSLKAKSSEILDEFGDRLYATFISISINCLPLAEYKENEYIKLRSEIVRYGDNIYVTSISSEQNIHAKLISSFTKRVQEKNTHLQKSVPLIKKNLIKEIGLPRELQDYKLIRKKLINEIDLGEISIPYSDESIFKYTHKVIPCYEINGIGLLYFASYPMINDIGEQGYFINQLNQPQLLFEYYTTARKVIYLGNCNRNDNVIFELNSFKNHENKIITQSSLYRESDNEKIAKIFTIKEKTTLNKD